MDVLRQFTPDVEVYSIDEAFLALPPAPPGALLGHGRTRCASACCAGPASPCTSAWAPPRRSPRWPTNSPARPTAACSRSPAPRTTRRCSATWPRATCGASARPTPRCSARHGVTTARALRDVPRPWARRHLTVVGERIVLELRGIALPAPRTPAAAARRDRAHAHVLAGPSTTLDAARARGGDLREPGGREGARPRPRRARPGGVHHDAQHPGPGPAPQRPPARAPARADELHAGADPRGGELVRRMYRPGLRLPQGRRDADRPARGERPSSSRSSQPRIPVPGASWARVDAINARMGAGTVHVAAAAPGMAQQHEPWQMRQARRSPAYTTSWHHLLRVPTPPPKAGGGGAQRRRG